MTTSTASQDSLESHFLLTSIWQAVAFSSRPAVLIPKLCWSPRLTNSQPSSSDMFSMSWALKGEKWKSFKWILYITHTRITYRSPSRQHITAILNMNTWQWADILQRFVTINLRTLIRCNMGKGTWLQPLFTTGLIRFKACFGNWSFECLQTFISGL